MDNKELEFSVLLRNLLKKKFKTTLIVMTILALGFCYNYLQPNKYKILLNFSFTNHFFPKVEISERIDYSHHLYLALELKNINHEFTIKLLRNFKNKPLKISLLEENLFIKKMTNNLTSRKKKLILNNLSSSIAFDSQGLSIIYSDVEEGKKILHYMLVRIFEETKDLTFSADLSKEDNKYEKKIIRDFFKDKNLIYWLKYKEQKFTFKKLERKKKINYISTILIALLCGFIYITYTAYKNEITLMKKLQKN